MKRKIFGVNAARLYEVEPVTAACTAYQAALEEYRAALAPKVSYGPETVAQARALMQAHGMV